MAGLANFDSEVAYNLAQLHTAASPPFAELQSLPP